MAKLHKTKLSELDTEIASLELQLLAKRRERRELGRGDNASDVDERKCIADPVFFLQNGQYSAVPTADIMYRSDMEAATASILQFLLPSAEAFTERDENDARIELLPVKGTNYLLGKLGKKHFLVPPGVSVLPTNQCSKYQEAYKQMTASMSE